MAYLILLRENNPIKTIKITGSSVTIGRNPVHDVALADPFLSRDHAKIMVLNDDTFEIHDVGGKSPVRINGKIIWSGGKRLIPIDLPASIEEGEVVYKTDELYTTKTKDYFRIDVGLKLHFFKKKSTHVFSLDIQNLTNRKKSRRACLFVLGIIFLKN